MKVRKLVKIIERDGWFLVRTKGGHRQYKHPVKSGLVTISGGLILPINVIDSAHILLGIEVPLPSNHVFKNPDGSGIVIYRRDIGGKYINI